MLVVSAVLQVVSRRENQHKNADAGNALIVGGQALSAQSQLNFSRDMEREADRIGFGVMTQAGFEAQGFVSMFEKLQQASRLNDSGAYPYLRSHPLTTERIADMQSRLPIGAASVGAKPLTATHAMMAARARVLSSTGADAMRGWQAQAESSVLAGMTPAAQAGALYGAAMAASRVRDASLARQHLDRLLQVVANDSESLTQTRWLAAEVALAAGDLPQPALLALSSSIGMAQTQSAHVRRPALMLQTQIALQGGQADVLNAVAQHLQTWVAVYPADGLAWQGLASVQAALNRPLRALRAEAESHVAQLDYAGALDRLKAAQTMLSSGSLATSNADHIDASIIDTRRRQIETLFREQSLEG